MRAQPERFVLLYEDELSVYRQPTQGYLWSAMGRRQPTMRYASKYNNLMRIVGYFNATTGAVHAHNMQSVTVDRLVASIRQIPTWYPEAECIYLVWDNWQNHRLPKIRKALALIPRLKVLYLPTYAPWLNPIEKVWRWLRQTTIHAHRWSNNFNDLRAEVMDALGQHAHGSKALLQYAGMSV